MDNPINGTPEVPTPDNDFDVVVTVGQDGEVVETVPTYEHNNCEAIIKRLTQERDTFIEETHRLRTEQIDGSDPRLATFWERAQELADNANHCEVFDQIAEALGGPSRVKEFVVTLYFTASWSTTVEARSEEDAIEQARESFGYNADEGDFENVDEDRYNATAEEV